MHVQVYIIVQELCIHACTSLYNSTRAVYTCMYKY